MIHRLVLIGFLATALLPRPGLAGSLEVFPVVSDLTPGQRSSVLTVTNRGESTVGVQVRSFAWSQSNGADQLTPTPELLVSPPIFELPAGGTQVVRLVLRLASDRQNADRSFRLLVDEIPASAAEGRVRFALRVSLPLFARQQASASPDIVWRCAPGGRVTALNRGGRHTVLTDLHLTLPGERSRPLNASATPYLLPGAERSWPVDGQTVCPAGTMRVNGRAPTGPFQANVLAGPVP